MTDPDYDCGAARPITQYPRQTSFWTFPDSPGTGARISLPGGGDRVTVLFGARGSYQRGGFAPWPLFECFWDDGRTRFTLRHNKTNQIKAPTGQINLDTTPYSDIGVWRRYRIDLEKNDPPVGGTVTVTVSIDGTRVWRNACKAAEASGGEPRFEFFHPATGTAHAAFSYILAVRDEAFDDDSPETLSALAGRDLTRFPGVDGRLFAFEPLPPVPAAETWPGDTHPFHVFPDGKRGLDPASLPFSGNRVLSGTGSHRARKVDAVGAAWPAFAESPQRGVAVVDPARADGPGRYATITEAVDALPAGGGTVLLSQGIYTEPLRIGGKDVRLVGNDPATTVVTGYRGYTNGIRGNVLVHLSEGKFEAENIAFYNRGAEWNAFIGHDEKRGAALCIERAGDCRFRNCWFLGQQDTLYLKNGTAVFEDCYVEGTTDFVCGGATALFSRCHLHALPARAAFVAAASPVNRCGFPLPDATARLGIPEPAGFVFHECTLTGDGRQETPVSLVRGPWTNGSGLGDAEKKGTPSAAAWIDCALGTGEKPVPLDRNCLWSDMDGPHAAELYTESGCAFQSPSPS